MGYAPVVLFVYNRPDHTRKTIESLKNNYLADKTDLFIYSDAPKFFNETKKDKKNISLVSEVRQYINSINGFKSVTIIEKEQNNGLANSIISGVTEVINDYNKVIVLEDDLISSPYFLQYMNSSLDYYENETQVFNVSAFSFNPSILNIPNDYPHDVYFLYRNSSWGWGTWKERWERAIWDQDRLRELISDEKNQLEFNKGGEDLTPMLFAQLNGEIDSWAIRWSFSISYNKGLSLTPLYSYISNIGFDGTGIHCGKSERESIIQNDINLSKNNMVFPKKIEIDRDIVCNFAKFYGDIPIKFLSLDEIMRMLVEYRKQNKELNIELNKVFGSKYWKVYNLIKKLIKR